MYFITYKLKVYNYSRIFLTQCLSSGCSFFLWLHSFLCLILWNERGLSYYKNTLIATKIGQSKTIIQAYIQFIFIFHFFFLCFSILKIIPYGSSKTYKSTNLNNALVPFAIYAGPRHWSLQFKIQTPNQNTRAPKPRWSDRISQRHSRRTVKILRVRHPLASDVHHRWKSQPARTDRKRNREERLLRRRVTDSLRAYRVGLPLADSYLWSDKAKRTRSVTDSVEDWEKSASWRIYLHIYTVWPDGVNSVVTACPSFRVECRSTVSSAYARYVEGFLKPCSFLIRHKGVVCRGKIFVPCVEH